MSSVEVNFDGLIGPTHNYAGLSYGNVASERNRDAVSNPRDAARQGLAKMRALMGMGLAQGVLPPQDRPCVATLRRLGFSGSDQTVVATAARLAPRLLASCSSASAMWTANAATVSPGADTADGRVHFTPANLVSKFHRSIEPDTTARALRTVFADAAHFAHHAPLPAVEALGDEGAANHTRFCPAPGTPGVELFVYGRKAFDRGVEPRRYPARQTLEASQAVARLHGLSPRRTVFAQQRPEVIDAGVFHNDVIAVGHGDVLFCHQDAFLDPRGLYAELQQAFGERPLQVIEVPGARVSVNDAVSTYLFNSQLLTLPGGDRVLVLPAEAREHQGVWTYLEELRDGDAPIQRLEVLDVRESMRNGGGPACLRLRVELSAAERAALGGRVLLDAALMDELDAWVGRHYRDRLCEADLADPQLLDEGRRALDELTQILKLGALYPFQRA